MQGVLPCQKLLIEFRNFVGGYQWDLHESFVDARGNLAAFLTSSKRDGPVVLLEIKNIQL